MTPATTSPEAHISMTVGGQEYRFVIDPRSFSEVDIIDWAPRAISGTPHRSELGNYLDVGQEDFGHGFGRERYEEEASYAWTGHGVDTSHGFAMLATDPTAVHNAANWVVEGFCVHRGKKLFACSGGAGQQGLHIEKEDGSLAFVLDQTMNDIMSNGEYCFTASDGGMIVWDVHDVSHATGTTVNVSGIAEWGTDFWAGGYIRVYEGTGAGTYYVINSNAASQVTTGVMDPILDETSKVALHIAAGVGGNPPLGYGKLWMFGGYMWGAEGAGTLGPWVHPWSEIDGSDAEGRQDTDTAAIRIGPGTVPITNMIAHQNRLWVCREDGAWVIGDDNLAYHILDFSAERHADNFKALCVWDGFLYFNIRNTLWKYKSGLQNVTPPLWDKHWPYKMFGGFVGLMPRGKFLYVAGRSNEVNALESTETAAFASILKTDGVGWHKILDMSHASGVDSCHGIWTDPEDDRLWYAYNAADGSDTSYLAYMRLQELSELPYADFPTSGDHNLYASYVDVDMMRVDKSLASLTLDAEFPANTSIIVSYRLDDTTALTVLGTFTSATKTVAFPASVVCKRVQLVFNLQTTAAARAPILRALILKVMIRPDTLYGVSCDVLVDDGLLAPGRTKLPMGDATTIRTALKAARDSKAPITFRNIWGESASAYVASLRFVVKESVETGLVRSVARISVVYV